MDEGKEDLVPFGGDIIAYMYANEELPSGRLSDAVQKNDVEKVREILKELTPLTLEQRQKVLNWGILVGMLPIWLATRRNAKIVKMLMYCGADVNKVVYGHSVLDFARDNNAIRRTVVEQLVCGDLHIKSRCWRQETSYEWDDCGRIIDKGRISDECHYYERDILLECDESGRVILNAGWAGLGYPFSLGKVRPFECTDTDTIYIR